MIGIIGAGNMGRAIALRMNTQTLISDKISARLRFGGKRCVKVAKNNIDLVRRSDIVIIAVKPQHIIKVLKEITPYVGSSLVISIAAGVKTVSIEKVLPKARVLRVMPNMPAIVGQGISAIVRGRLAKKKDVDIAERIFSKVGDVVRVKESSMDAVTALSGSGPAYYFLFTDILEKAGHSLGLKKDLARQLTLATFMGASASASAMKISMQDFVKKVASKGGTTEAALKVFKQRGLDRIVKAALRAAYARSCTLSRSRRKK
ncbi:MAG: pyrroline-5-carboxylate reductase [Candidatus Omnitrophica bacterium]|nr:pyrroline-5-carboxylate reductase [Candidatus Omnitrophota bacterium]